MGGMEVSVGMGDGVGVARLISAWAVGECLQMKGMTMR